jgi:hypothetical protein
MPPVIIQAPQMERKDLSVLIELHRKDSVSILKARELKIKAKYISRGQWLDIFEDYFAFPKEREVIRPLCVS